MKHIRECLTRLAERFSVDSSICTPRPLPRSPSPLAAADPVTDPELEPVRRRRPGLVQQPTGLSRIGGIDRQHDFPIFPRRHRTGCRESRSPGLGENISGFRSQPILGNASSSIRAASAVPQVSDSLSSSKAHRHRPASPPARRTSRSDHPADPPQVLRFADADAPPEPRDRQRGQKTARLNVNSPTPAKSIP